jgi:hypothetical protein
VMRRDANDMQGTYGSENVLNPMTKTSSTSKT